jgi:hypothetical protein
MTTITQLAKAVDEIVHRTAPDKFGMEATLFGCDDAGAHLLGVNGDPYELLWASNRTDNIKAIALVVTGWASPIEDDGNDVPPSKHPERVRIRLVVCKGIDGFSTVMRRADTPDEVQDMGDEGTGSLRDAMEAWWSR